MEQYILITQLNDFIFCPASIYFHNLYENADVRTVQTTDQTLGTESHKTITQQRYSSHVNVLQGIYVFSEKYNLLGKIDIFDVDKRLLTERKRQIRQIFDGYIFQLYGQYFGLTDMGYNVTALRLFSQLDNKIYPVPLPQDNNDMLRKFENTINAIEQFDIRSFVQTNPNKCQRCIYYNACDRGL
ncbi:MAG TPA: type V CRISPR-associated protein Cas4 [Clostridiaceae bacterium]|nr:type V CRISPR-associated protein Cas4 [Clostridiaceae bacterium]